MGTWFQFNCSNCDYTASVSGGRDVGMQAVVRTMTCSDCAEIGDVMIGMFGQDGPTGNPEMDKDLGKCPGCDGESVRPWPRTHPCPKCGSKEVEQLISSVYAKTSKKS